MRDAAPPIEGRGFAVRAALVIAATVAAAIAFALMLAFLKFEQRMQDVLVARLALVVDDVRTQTETALALGLELSELEDLAGVLQRAGGARDVLQIDLLQRNGTVVFSTAPALVATREPASTQNLGSRPEYAALAAVSGGALQRHVVGDTLILSHGLLDGLGANAGSVVVQASLAGQRQALRGIGLELLRSALPVLVLALLLTLVLVIVTLRVSLRAALPRKATQGDAPAERLGR